ncbi:hypothetical protein [Pseudomonas sp. MWU12-3103b]|uniref:hypothetical protein n=1 Tax=Pseudomonas sp. MWU12-3103b TaxID=2928857 RepID=UPI001FFE596A|nr:hypothetical protein [Pseudomonas sp. MWU12-3103b]
MKTVFEDIITRYGTKREDFIAETLPKSPKWLDFMKVSDYPRDEEYFDEEMEFYRAFELELDAIPKLRNKKNQLTPVGGDCSLFKNSQRETVISS